MKKIYPLVLILPFLLSYCQGTQVSTGTMEKKVLGVWTSTSITSAQISKSFKKVIFTFREDNTFSLTVTMVNDKVATLHGTYSVSMEFLNMKFDTEKETDKVSYYFDKDNLILLDDYDKGHVVLKRVSE